MSVLRPVPMAKVGLVALKDDRERLLSVLHDLGVVQVEPIGKQSLQYLEPEHASETQRAVSDELLRFRGLKNALPPSSNASPQRFSKLEELLSAAQKILIDEEVGRLKREEDKLLTERKSITDSLDVLRRFDLYTDRYDLLTTRNILAFFGEASVEAYATLRSQVPATSDVQFLEARSGEKVRFLIAVRSEQAEALSRLVQQQGVALVSAPRLAGTAAEELPRLVSRLAGVDHRLKEIETRLWAIATEWYPTVAALEEGFAIENRKLEVYTRLGSGVRTFALEGWVPKRDLARLESELMRTARGRALVYPIETEEEPPTLMDNPKGIRWFEFFIRFYSLPQATEWDPTIVFAIVFPIFFGFMLGDWGYGLVILLVSLWMIAGFPAARYLPKFGRNFVKLILRPNAMRQLAYALLPGCVLAIGLGVVFDEFFGYPLFHNVFGYTPIIAPERNVGSLLLFAGFIGLGMVTMGFLLGSLKEYFHHRSRAAVGKLGGIFFAWGVAFFGLAVIHHQSFSPSVNPLVGVYYALMAIGPILLVAGEGAQMGLMGIIEIVSHILSYTRLVGILLASVILALVINTVFAGGFYSGTVVGVIAALFILILGQTFNVIIGVFEPGIQGARLIFVENFSKFFSGNGRPFRPFGSRRTHTLPTVGEGPTMPVGASAIGSLVPAS